MSHIILRTNATPIYAFLSRIHSLSPVGADSQRRKILDCGAGGPVPPLALFAQQGFEAWGIDISEPQVARAQAFCVEQGLNAHLQTGDMRDMRFEDASFDYVYEHYAMCHLSKDDTARAVDQMRRVTKPGGLCFLGVISMESWPKSLFGEEAAPGEYWQAEGDGDPARHTMFTDIEADTLVADWEILHKEKRTIYLRVTAEAMSRQAWSAAYEETDHRLTYGAWMATYKDRATRVRYAHLYYTLRKHR